MTRKRTKKVFVPYNDHEDRPVGKKWATAFALPELTKTIDEGFHESLRTVEELSQMKRCEIDKVLQQAFLKNKCVSIQTNERDDRDRLLVSKEGMFSGMGDETYIYLNDEEIEWDVIRNVTII